MIRFPKHALRWILSAYAVAAAVGGVFVSPYLFIGAALYGGFVGLDLWSGRRSVL